MARQVIAVSLYKSEYRFEAESCGVFSFIHEQSDDINRGVDAEVQSRDQGMMFGYATNELSYMPLPIDQGHALMQERANIRKNQSERCPTFVPMLSRSDC